MEKAYEHKSVTPGRSYQVDDELIFWLIKALRNRDKEHGKMHEVLSSSFPTNLTHIVPS